MRWYLRTFEAMVLLAAIPALLTLAASAMFGVVRGADGL
jgi:hypothetical protein